MTEATLTRSMRTYELEGYTDEVALFLHDDDIDGIRLGIAPWSDMGRPNRITVTIEPGDRVGIPLSREARLERALRADA